MPTAHLAASLFNLQNESKMNKKIPDIPGAVIITGTWHAIADAKLFTRCFIAPKNNKLQSQSEKTNQNE